MSGVGAARCTANPKLSVGLGRGGGALCLLSPPCTRTGRPARLLRTSRVDLGGVHVHSDVHA
eukprot:3805384-Prymnesium_polylepis.1